MGQKLLNSHTRKSSHYIEGDKDVVKTEEVASSSLVSPPTTPTLPDTNAEDLEHGSSDNEKQDDILAVEEHSDTEDMKNSVAIKHSLSRTNSVQNNYHYIKYFN